MNSKSFPRKPIVLFFAILLAIASCSGCSNQVGNNPSTLSQDFLPQSFVGAPSLNSLSVVMIQCPEQKFCVGVEYFSSKSTALVVKTNSEPNWRLSNFPDFITKSFSVVTSLSCTYTAYCLASGQTGNTTFLLASVDQGQAWKQVSISGSSGDLGQIYCYSNDSCITAGLDENGNALFNEFHIVDKAPFISEEIIGKMSLNLSLTSFLSSYCDPIACLTGGYSDGQMTLFRISPAKAQVSQFFPEYESDIASSKVVSIGCTSDELRCFALATMIFSNGNGTPKIVVLTSTSLFSNTWHNSTILDKYNFDAIHGVACLGTGSNMKCIMVAHIAGSKYAGSVFVSSGNGDSWREIGNLVGSQLYGLINCQNFIQAGCEIGDFDKVPGSIFFKLQ